MSEHYISVLVIGGTGFIGTTLLRRLTAAGHQTTALVFADRGQLARFPAIDGVQVREAASSQPADVAAALGGQSFEVVVNLAASGVRPDDRNSSALADGNLGLLNRLLDAFSEAPPGLFLHAGSWSEYAPNEEGMPITEDHPLQSGLGYGGAKAEAEILGRALAAERGISFVTLRLFHVYGPGESAHRLTPYLIERLTAGQPAKLSPGDQVRDFLYVDDAADAFMAAARAQNFDTHGAYNICTGDPVPVRQVAENLAAAMDKPPSLLHFGALPLRDGDPPWVVGDNSRFTAVANWRPRISLEQGIQRTVDAATANLKIRHG